MPVGHGTPKPAIYYKARTRIIEEIAIQQVADNIRESDEGIALPGEWMHEIDSLRTRIYELIKEASDEDAKHR